MIPGKTLVRVALLACTLMFSQVSLADPVRCSPGYQDSTCTPALSNAPQAQPQCPNSAGWTTAAGSTWIGSRWTPPTCNYQAQPSCPPGYDETSGPIWNGSAWVGMICAPSVPHVSIADQQAACLSYGLAHDFYPIRWTFTPYEYNGPYDGTGTSAYNTSVPLLAWEATIEAVWVGTGSFPPPANAPTQMIVVKGAAVDVCWFTPGTTNLVGQYNLTGNSGGGNGG